MPKKYRKIHETFVTAAELTVGEDRVISRKMAKQVADSLGQDQPNWLFNDRSYRHGRGQYVLPVLSISSVTPTVEEEVSDTVMEATE